MFLKSVSKEEKEQTLLQPKTLNFILAVRNFKIRVVKVKSRKSQEEFRDNRLKRKYEFNRCNKGI